MQVDEGLLQGGEQEPRLRVGVGGHQVQAEHQVRTLAELGRRELSAIEGGGLVHHLRREMRGECERQAKRRRQLGAVEAGPQHPHGNLRARAWDGADRLPRLRVLQEGQELHDILRELLDAAGQVAAQRAGGELVGPRRAADAQVDPARIDGLEGPELLGDDQRRVVGQHHATGAEADGRGPFADVGQRHGGGGAGDAGHVVVLGQPVAPVAQPLGSPRQGAAGAQRLSRAATLDDGRKVEDGKGNHAGYVVGRSSARTANDRNNCRSGRRRASGERGRTWMSAGPRRPARPSAPR